VEIEAFRNRAIGVPPSAQVRKAPPSLPPKEPLLLPSGEVSIDKAPTPEDVKEVEAVQTDVPK
jgi:hypothetical protein